MYFKYGNFFFIGGLALNFIGGILTSFFEIVGLTMVVITFIYYIIGFNQDQKIKQISQSPLLTN